MEKDGAEGVRKVHYSIKEVPRSRINFTTMTTPSHTKDFKEAAEKRFNEAVKDGPIISPCECFTWDDIKDYSIKDFTAGCEFGYAEAMKEQREFYLAVRDWFRFRRSDLTIEVITKHLSSFTEQEQSNTKDNG
jgi:hypothetical protein